MDDAVGGSNVGNDDFSVINHDLAICIVDQDWLALDGLSRAEGNNVAGEDLTGNDMVEQDVGQSGDISEQSIDSAFRERSKSVIGRGKHGERTVALKRLNQVSSAKGGNQGGETAVCNGNFGDILRRRQNDRS